MTQLDFITTEHLTLTEAFEKFVTIKMPVRNFSTQTRRGYTYDLTEWLKHAQVTYVRELNTYSIEHSYYIST